MMMTRAWLSAGVVCVGTTFAFAADTGHAAYTAEQVGRVVRLSDVKNQTVVSLMPSVGNLTFEMRVKGHNVLHFPFESIDDFHGGFYGIPFLGPWANRLDEPAFYANGRRYAFDMELGNVRGTIPMHGFLAFTDQWRVVDVQADATSAWVTSRLELFRNPLWMKQFPFAHAIELTHRLRDGVLEVRTRIQNMSLEPMPVAIGFHPYFQLTDSLRDEWTISVGARRQWVLADNKIPTGEIRPIERFIPNPESAALRDYDLDHVFGDLVRDASGRALMSVKGRLQQIDVLLGANYRAVVVYAPRPALPAGPGGPSPAAAPPNPTAQNRNFICFEPMAGITNAMNAAHKGLYAELQSIPPGGVWEESFWVRPSGF